MNRNRVFIQAADTTQLLAKIGGDTPMPGTTSRRSWFRVALVATAVATLVLLGLTLAGCGASPNVVHIKNLRFDPQYLTVKKGAEVEWINNDQTAHTITSDDFKEGSNNPKQFNSEALDPGKSFKHRFDSVGTYRYHCSVHPYLKGVVTVTE